ncbi:NAD(P)/FAD-dependent oxidoreductase [Desertibaculum subflavum]|uniref:NAD(P)/FAD-dependent oxidoreductase n=1 Tax=Desertibaculum subflavum TaxID=2268458 RepID=UPI000E668858
MKTEPYWWDAARPSRPEPEPLPPRADVVVIGGGITGLVAALDLARGGRHVVVLDRDAIGAGASTRNAGYLGRTLKHGFAEIMAADGLARAVAVYGEMQAAFDSVADLIRDEGIDCGFARCGRFTAAPTPAHYAALARELALRERHLGHPFEMLPRTRQHEEIATDLWHGGAVIPDLGALHPGLYHAGLAARAGAAGAVLHGGTAVRSVSAEADRTIVDTARGRIEARDVLATTNGYTDDAAGLRNHVLPFDAYMIATEPLPQTLMQRLIPQGRTVIDDGRNPLFVRPSPDGSRILFGGHTGRRVRDLGRMAARLRRSLIRLLPDLGDVAVGHVWTGRCAGTGDLYPHIGSRGRIHHAMGYCFAGVPMGTHLGRKLAARLLGRNSGATAFDGLPLRPVPAHGIAASLTPLVLRWWEWRDRPRSG